MIFLFCTGQRTIRVAVIPVDMVCLSRADQRTRNIAIISVDMHLPDSTHHTTAAVAALAVKMSFLCGTQQHSLGITSLTVAMTFLLGQFTDQSAPLTQETRFCVSMVALQFIASFPMGVRFRLCKCADQDIAIVSHRFTVAAVSMRMLLLTAEGFLLLGNRWKHKGIGNAEYDNAPQGADNFLPPFPSMPLPMKFFGILQQFSFHGHSPSVGLNPMRQNQTKAKHKM